MGRVSGVTTVPFSMGTGGTAGDGDRGPATRAGDFGAGLVACGFSFLRGSDVILEDRRCVVSFFRRSTGIRCGSGSGLKFSKCLLRYCNKRK